MAIDLHKNPFDEATKVKLSLYENYMKEWLPVFLSQSGLIRNINIFDLFCGPGKDKRGEKGSPLIVLDIILEYLGLILSKSSTISLYFNDNRTKKIDELRKEIGEYHLDIPKLRFSFSCQSFESIFPEYLSIMRERGAANFLFLDQNGIKHINQDVFGKIVDTPYTDFLFFVSSSTLIRFSNVDSIKKYFSFENKEPVDYCHVHRKVCEHYRSYIPKNKEYYLAPFSIKKGANIYGLIFGTGNLLGIEKFVNQCWKIDPHTGDSNFNIDKDCMVDSPQLRLFPRLDRPKKIQKFEKEIEEAVLSKKLKTNKDIYGFALFNGFKAEQARKVIAEMIKSGKLPQQKLKISYSSCKSSAEEQFIKLD